MEKFLGIYNFVQAKNDLWRLISLNRKTGSWILAKQGEDFIRNLSEKLSGGETETSDKN